MKRKQKKKMYFEGWNLK